MWTDLFYEDWENSCNTNGCEEECELIYKHSCGVDSCITCVYETLSCPACNQKIPFDHVESVKAEFQLQERINYKLSLEKAALAKFYWSFLVDHVVIPRGLFVQEPPVDSFFKPAEAGVCLNQHEALLFVLDTHGIPRPHDL